MSAHVETLRWEGGLPGHCALIEQTRLPLEEVWLRVDTVPAMHDAIKRLAVRGAPAIGVAAGYGVVLGVQNLSTQTADEVLRAALECADYLATSRPTAVNLFWALDRMKARARREHAAQRTGADLVRALHAEALLIHEEDRAMCQAMGQHGAPLIEDGMGILTHCNAGALATGGMGTALAPIYTAMAQGKRVKVYADETRPLLQGARLTVYELMKAGADVTLITDNMAASLMRTGAVDLVFVGSDRIAVNGDVCNKIGTYSVALAAREHGVPFYAVAPTSTFDPHCKRGEDIHIEEREAAEICEGFGRRTAPHGTKVWNPAFDWTPARMVSGIVCEHGLIRKPNQRRVEAVLARAGRLAVQ
jgi:methylthioribose-1-phosphate isomerase